MELVSIIVPVYNVEKYLPECLDSILASTYTNLEVIVVDDGSPDNCPQICDEYAKKDLRIRVIHQENQGLVGARNAGLEAATGKYVAFVDSDDMVSPVLYETLVKAIEQQQADIAACEYTNDVSLLRTSNDLSKTNFQTIKGFDQQLAILTCAPSVQKMTWTYCYVWNKLYRRNRVQSNFKKECLMCEDLRFNWDYIQNSASMVVISSVMYLYRVNENSITAAYNNQRINPATVKSGIANAQLWELIAKDPRISSAELQAYLDAHAAYRAHRILWRIFCSNQEAAYGDYIVNARETMRHNSKQLLRDTKTHSLAFLCSCWMCINCFPIWKKIAKVFGPIRK